MEIAENIKHKQVIKEPQESRFPFYTKGLVGGIMAGIGMGLGLLLINSKIEGVHTGWSFAKYLVLGLILSMLIGEYKASSAKGKTFKDGIVLGGFTTLCSAVVLIVFNTLINALGIDSIQTTRYNVEADSLSNILMLNGVLFFECFVFGMVFTFIWLQFFKDAKPAQ